jgi:ABC-type uncharacterized transport system permease subunit
MNLRPCDVLVTNLIESRSSIISRLLLSAMCLSGIYVYADDACASVSKSDPLFNGVLANLFAESACI